MNFKLTKKLRAFFLKNTVLSNLAFFILLISSNSSQAVNISAYRIYLDEDKRDASFVIFNKESNYQECVLNLAHNNFDNDSQLIHLPDDVVPENSAKDWIRYSPREFLLTPAQSQTVRFSMRRRANSQDGEYRSYLVIDCGLAPTRDESGKLIPQVSLQTKLIHSVPIIVRTGKLDAKVWFDNFQTTQNGLRFTLNRSGSRSVYGDIEVIDKETEEVIFTQRNFSIYPESERYHFYLEKNNMNFKNLKVRYIENKKFGGDILHEQDMF